MIEILVWPLVLLILGVVVIFTFKEQISMFIQEIGHLKTKWFEIERIRKEVFAKAEEVEKVKVNLREIMRSYVETYAFDLKTRNQIPPPPDVIKKAQEELNSIIKLLFPTKDERVIFVKTLQEKLNSLP